MSHTNKFLFQIGWLAYINQDDFLKQVEQMVINNASYTSPRTTLCGYYFYNYFTRGIDILFDSHEFSHYRGSLQFHWDSLNEYIAIC